MSLMHNVARMSQDSEVYVYLRIFMYIYVYIRVSPRCMRVRAAYLVAINSQHYLHKNCKASRRFETCECWSLYAPSNVCVYVHVCVYLHMSQLGVFVYIYIYIHTHTLRNLWTSEDQFEGRSACTRLIMNVGGVFCAVFIDAMIDCYVCKVHFCIYIRQCTVVTYMHTYIHTYSTL